MHVAEQHPFVKKLVGEPYDAAALASVHRALSKDPESYARLLEQAAERTAENPAASHWLTEAARVRVHALGDDRGGARLLEAALERDPLNLRAAEHLVELYRAHREDAELAALVRARANALRKRYSSEPVPMPRAALAFEKLSGVYEALGDSTAAIETLRTALELERAQGARYTTPSPPPGTARRSSFRPRSDVGQGEAPAPEAPWSSGPSSRPARDTVRSSVPVDGPGSSTEPVSLPAPPPAVTEAPASDPLLAVIEALHALRKMDGVVDGAALILKTALVAIPSVAGFVHVADVSTRDFVVVAASGAQNAEIIGTRASETDALFVRAQDAGEAISVEATSPDALDGARFHVVCPTHAVLCAPAQYDGRNLGAIELVDPTRRATFSDGDRHAMTYVAERFAEFLSDRSIAF